MDPSNIAAIAVELCDLLQLQLETVMGRRLTNFTPDELGAYQKRKARVEELRSELHRLANPTK
jgi:hypothetical protein